MSIGQLGVSSEKHSKSVSERKVLSSVAKSRQIELSDAQFSRRVAAAANSMFFSGLDEASRRSGCGSTTLEGGQNLKHA